MPFNVPITPARVRTIDDEVAIFGAGLTGAMVKQEVERGGGTVRFFLDGRELPAAAFHGVPAYTPSSLPMGANATQIIIAIHNPDADIAEIRDSLQTLGFRQPVSMVDWVNASPYARGRYWLGRYDDVLSQWESIMAFEALLADDRSRSTLRDALEFRLGTSLSCPPSNSLQDQYAPVDVERWPSPIRLIDCGAYRGSAIDTLTQRGYRIAQAVALEPDLVNFAHLAARRDLSNVLRFPIAVSDQTGLLSFSSEGAMSSHIEDKGLSRVPVCTLDEALSDFAPTLIKMDIEGSEQAALRGAISILEQVRPDLAIAAYHSPDDLWSLGLWLAALDLDYEFHLRTHAHSTFDTVLYARRER